ncbi:MAG: isocitrate/isopropylmalate dehydrogenase family protein [Sandaracinaceae bacterium]|nr:isocitrate/isopropylmalate dehydrogenase family protein [Sandaracinaceae bacterium]
MKRIAIIAGDGIGKEVVAVGTALLEKLREVRGYPLELLHFDLGADRFLRDGTTFPEADQRTIRESCDAILLGALGDPRVPDLGYARDILFGLRFGLDLYCNIRPVVCLADRLMPLKGKTAADCDMVVFRENTEGIYVNVGGQFKRGTPDEIAINEDVNSRKGVERIIRAAFEWAVEHGKTRVHMTDKSNAMRAAGDLWQRTFREVAASYPAIEAKHQYVDALCLNFVRDPGQFQVIVTNNLFGDIVTDLGAALQGGLGMAASANVQPGRVSMFEPVHGSAPDIAGKDLANPLATVLTVGLMMTHLGFLEEEARLTAIVKRAVDEKKCTRDVGGELGTKATGAWVLDQIR